MKYDKMQHSKFSLPVTVTEATSGLTDLNGDNVVVVELPQAPEDDPLKR